MSGRSAYQRQRSAKQLAKQKDALTRKRVETWSDQTPEGRIKTLDFLVEDIVAADYKMNEVRVQKRRQRKRKRGRGGQADEPPAKKLKPGGEPEKKPPKPGKEQISVMVTEKFKALLRGREKPELRERLLNFAITTLKRLCEPLVESVRYAALEEEHSGTGPAVSSEPQELHLRTITRALERSNTKPLLGFVLTTLFDLLKSKKPGEEQHKVAHWIISEFNQPVPEQEWILYYICMRFPKLFLERLLPSEEFTHLHALRKRIVDQNPEEFMLCVEALCGRVLASEDSGTVTKRLSLLAQKKAMGEGELNPEESPSIRFGRYIDKALERFGESFADGSLVVDPELLIRVLENCEEMVVPFLEALLREPLDASPGLLDAYNSIGNGLADYIIELCKAALSAPVIGEEAKPRARFEAIIPRLSSALLPALPAAFERKPNPDDKRPAWFLRILDVLLAAWSVERPITPLHFAAKVLSVSLLHNLAKPAMCNSSWQVAKMSLRALLCGTRQNRVQEELFFTKLATTCAADDVPIASVVSRLAAIVVDTGLQREFSQAALRNFADVCTCLHRAASAEAKNCALILLPLLAGVDSSEVSYEQGHKAFRPLFASWYALLERMGSAEDHGAYLRLSELLHRLVAGNHALIEPCIYEIVRRVLDLEPALPPYQRSAGTGKNEPLKRLRLNPRRWLNPYHSDGMPNGDELSAEMSPEPTNNENFEPFSPTPSPAKSLQSAESSVSPRKSGQRSPADKKEQAEAPVAEPSPAKDEQGTPALDSELINDLLLERLRKVCAIQEKYGGWRILAEAIFALTPNLPMAQWAPPYTRYVQSASSKEGYGSGGPWKFDQTVARIFDTTALPGLLYTFVVGARRLGPMETIVRSLLNSCVGYWRKPVSSSQHEEQFKYWAWRTAYLLDLHYLCGRIPNVLWRVRCVLMEEPAIPNEELSTILRHTAKLVWKVTKIHDSMAWSKNRFYAFNQNVLTQSKDAIRRTFMRDPEKYQHISPFFFAGQSKRPNLRSYSKGVG